MSRYIRRDQPAPDSYVTPAPTAIPLLVTCDFLGAGGIGENLLGSVDRVQKACELANIGFTCVVACCPRGLVHKIGSCTNIKYKFLQEVQFLVQFLQKTTNNSEFL